MGLHFGNLGIRVRGVVSFAISPYEQRAMAGFLSRGFPNLIRRFNGQAFIIGPPLIASYLYYDYINTKAEEMSRKNPADFAADV
ncbi:hypothetical protein CAPTEDRAFT_151328 [Capitella teleta]|uniref:Cytochrome b-c1 complex subunit 8 n=1 Tax=Capitella teleta TaxID=283909 RepID=R7U2D6_CAPTE|nr:hypothetical protein CAPTEDRAFT_151328 [Capitella teleta]|eukprot:ELU00170.1 hypothetical protein CAPTEDRAFT_151328 [Capitella teleta]